MQENYKKNIAKIANIIFLNIFIYHKLILFTYISLYFFKYILAVAFKVNVPSGNLLHKDLFLIHGWPTVMQWWSVTKYNYFVTVLKYIFQVSVLYWSSFILSNFYFYFTTFQSIRSYFLLHYIS